MRCLYFKSKNIMRKVTIVIYMLALFNAKANAQFQLANPMQSVRVGEVMNGPYTIAKLTYLVDELNQQDTTYTFSFRDARYKDRFEYVNVNFKSEGNAKEHFYSIVKTVFGEENKRNKQYEVSFKLGNDFVQVKNFRFTGITYAMIVFNGKAQTIPLLKSYVDKIFGKK